MFCILTIKRTHIIVFIIALIALCTSVFAQFIFDKKPCLLCLISRSLYFLIAVIAAISFVFKKKIIRKIIFALVSVSLIFSMYHLGVENHWWRAPKTCAHKIPTAEELKNIEKQFITQNTSPSCDQVNWEIFGISSTLWNFGMFAGLFWMISVAYAMSYSKRKQEDE